MSNVRHVPTACTTTRILARGATIDSHRHDEHQIAYAGSGLVAVTTPCGTWFAPGTRAVWIPAGTVHAHRAHGSLRLHLVGLPRDTNPLGLERPAALAVGPLLRELLLALAGQSDDGSPERGRLRAVLVDQLRASARQPAQLPTPSDPRLLAVCRMLDDDPSDGRTLAALGSAVGAGERTLSRLFRAELGMTFPQWRTQLRLFHALRMLADGRSVTAVAGACGWATASAFIDVFRQAYGYTPGMYGRRV